MEAKNLHRGPRPDAVPIRVPDESRVPNGRIRDHKQLSLPGVYHHPLCLRTGDHMPEEVLGVDGMFLAVTLDGCCCLEVNLVDRDPVVDILQG